MRKINYIIIRKSIEDRDLQVTHTPFIFFTCRCHLVIVAENAGEAAHANGDRVLFNKISSQR